MFENILVPLILADTLSLVEGKTRFQKLMFLIQKKATEQGIDDLTFDYEIYLHGPFSRELSLTIDDLVRRDFLREDAEETPSGYTKYVYTLTGKGKRFLKNAKNKRLLSPIIIKATREIVKRYGNLPLPKLVDKAYEQF